MMIRRVVTLVPQQKGSAQCVLSSYVRSHTHEASFSLYSFANPCERLRTFAKLKRVDVRAPATSLGMSSGRFAGFRLENLTPCASCSNVTLSLDLQALLVRRILQRDRPRSLLMVGLFCTSHVQKCMSGVYHWLLNVSGLPYSLLTSVFTCDTMLLPASMISVLHFPSLFFANMFSSLCTRFTFRRICSKSGIRRANDGFR